MLNDSLLFFIKYLSAIFAVLFLIMMTFKYLQKRGLLQRPRKFQKIIISDRVFIDDKCQAIYLEVENKNFLLIKSSSGLLLHELGVNNEPISNRRAS